MFYTITMLKLSTALVNIPVLSLRTNSPIAVTQEPIFNPHNLKLVGWYCRDNFSKARLVLLTKDIRDIIDQGILVNDHDVLSEPSELIRMEELLKLNFQLLGKRVITSDGSKLGKVNDYAIDATSFLVQKIYVGQLLIRSLSDGNLSIDRNQIVEITPHKIVVQELTQSIKESLPATVPLNPA